MPDKRIHFDTVTLDALGVLGRDEGRTLQELMDEAVADFLKKHRRPAGLKNACAKACGARRPTRTSEERDKAQQRPLAVRGNPAASSIGGGPRRLTMVSSSARSLSSAKGFST